MRIIVISTQNSLLSGAISKYLRDRSEMRPECVPGDHAGETADICRAVSADILLMEVAYASPFSFDDRMAATRLVRQYLPGCRVAFLCDENASPDLAEKVKDAKKLGFIDGFFYCSVSGDYLAAALDTM